MAKNANPGATECPTIANSHLSEGLFYDCLVKEW